MVEHATLYKKINEDFWVAHLEELALEPVIQRRNGQQVEKLPGRQFMLTEKSNVLLNQVARDKAYNKFLFLTTAVYIWTRKFSGNQDQVLVTSAVNGFTSGNASGLLFLCPSATGQTVVRSFLRSLHEQIEQLAPKADYDFYSFRERVALPGQAGGETVYKWGIVYDKVNEVSDHLDLVNVLFSFSEAETGRMALTITCRDSNWSDEDRELIAAQFCSVLYHTCNDLDALLLTANLVSDRDRQIMTAINNNRHDDYPPGSFLQLFAEQVTKKPGSVGVVCEERLITYEELDKLSDKVAAYLKYKASVVPGSIVGLLVGHNEWRMISILGILKAGAAYVPVKPDFPLNRIRFMLQDCSCTVLLTESCYSDLLKELETDITARFVTDAIDTQLQLPVTVQGNDLFVVLYTSGSSGTPKGVLIEHGNMMDRLMGEVKLYSLDETICTIQTSNYAFDSSLLDLFLPFVTGGRLVIPTEEELYDYDRLASLINEQGVTDLQANPNFLKSFMEACISMKKTFTGSLQRIWSGGESLTGMLVGMVKQHVPDVMISNHYGPTEGTIDALVNKNVTDFSRNIIGKPIYNMQVYIMDEGPHILPVNFPGEICISGKGLARGYLNLPGLTGEKFVPHPFSPGERLYRTGDSGRLLPDGTVEYLGRLDDQIKIRGYRIELGEVENVLLKQKHIKDVVVLAKADAAGTKFLVAYYSKEAAFTIAELRSSLQAELPDFMIPSFFVELDRLPLTSTGKTDRKLLDSLPYTSITADSVAPKNKTEQQLHKTWKKILLRDNISTNSNFFEIGGQSLKATQLMFQVFREFEVKLSLKDVFSHPTIAALAAFIQGSAKSQYTSIPAAAPKAYYDASNAQKRLWLIAQHHEMQTAYNLPDGYMLKGSIDEPAFEKAFFAMISRHESLRTTFFFTGSELKQQIHTALSLFRPAYEFYDISGLTTEEQEQSTEQYVEELLGLVFDLETAPLLKVALIKKAPREYLFLISIHHIVCDEWSLEVFVEEFLALYDNYTGRRSHDLQPLPIQYKDYSEWKNNLTDTYEQQEAYWLKLFNGPLPVLQLPYDRERSWEAGEEGTVLTELDGELLQQLHTFSNQQGCTLFITLLAVYNVFLHRISGQEDIVIGTITSGRDNPELEYLVGYFANTLALRNQPVSTASFVAFLQEVKQRTLEAFMNQDYGFEELVEKLDVERAFNRHPLFDVLFEFQQAIEVGSEQFTVEAYEYPHQPIAKFDLAVSVTELKNSITIVWTYNRLLFEEETVRSMAGYFLHTLKIVLANPGMLIGEIDLLEGSKRAYHRKEAPVLSETQLFNFKI